MNDVSSFVTAAIEQAEQMANAEPTRLAARPEFEMTLARFDSRLEEAIQKWRAGIVVDERNHLEITNPLGMRELDVEIWSGGSVDFDPFLSQVIVDGLESPGTMIAMNIGPGVARHLTRTNLKLRHGHSIMSGLEIKVDGVKLKPDAPVRLQKKMVDAGWIALGWENYYKVDDKNLPIEYAYFNFSGNSKDRTFSAPEYEGLDEQSARFVFGILREEILNTPVRTPRLATIQSIDKEGKMDIVTDDLAKGKLSDTCFYPWMKGTSLRQYFLDFFHSSANVLILYGPPGTAKSTMIRTAVKELGLRALGTANQNLIANPMFLTACGSRMAGNPNSGEAPYDVLIAEDAEVLLRPRSEGNEAMSTLLDVTNGLGTTHSFKLILTMNAPDLERVDPALLRPGRCFDVMKFGRLNAMQGSAVRNFLEMPVIDIPAGNYTIAELIHLGDTKSLNVNGNSIVQARFPL